MPKTRFVVLIDFSSYSEAQLRLAEAWCMTLDAELLLVHRVSAVVPVMADREMKDQVVSDRKKAAQEQLRQYAAGILVHHLEVHFHITEQNLLSELPLLLRNQYDDLVFVGLKGTGFLKKYLLGSTAAAMIDQLDHIVVAVPSTVASWSVSVLHFAVSPRHPLNNSAFDRFLERFSSVIQRIHFISILADDDSHGETCAYLEELTQQYTAIKPTTTDVFYGNDAFSSLKNYMYDHPDGVLVVQRGSRSLTDQIFRRYLVDELVDHGHIPLIVLP